MPTRPRSSAANRQPFQLRYLQTLLEVGADQSATIVFPLPLDLIKPFLERAAAPHDENVAAKGTDRRTDAETTRVIRSQPDGS